MNSSILSTAIILLIYFISSIKTDQVQTWSINKENHVSQTQEIQNYSIDVDFSVIQKVVFDFYFYEADPFEVHRYYVNIQKGTIPMHTKDGKKINFSYESIWNSEKQYTFELGFSLTLFKKESKTNTIAYIQVIDYGPGLFDYEFKKFNFKITPRTYTDLQLKGTDNCSHYCKGSCEESLCICPKDRIGDDCTIPAYWVDKDLSTIITVRAGQQIFVKTEILYKIKRIDFDWYLDQEFRSVKYENMILVNIIDKYADNKIPNTENTLWKKYVRVINNHIAYEPCENRDCDKKDRYVLGFHSISNIDIKFILNIIYLEYIEKYHGKAADGKQAEKLYKGIIKTLTIAIFFLAIGGILIACYIWIKKNHKKLKIHKDKKKIEEFEEEEEEVEEGGVGDDGEEGEECENEEENCEENQVIRRTTNDLEALEENSGQCQDGEDGIDNEDNGNDTSTKRRIQNKKGLNSVIGSQ